MLKSLKDILFPDPVQHAVDTFGNGDPEKERLIRRRIGRIGFDSDNEIYVPNIENEALHEAVTKKYESLKNVTAKPFETFEEFSQQSSIKKTSRIAGMGALALGFVLGIAAAIYSGHPAFSLQFLGVTGLISLTVPAMTYLFLPSSETIEAKNLKDYSAYLDRAMPAPSVERNLVPEIPVRGDHLEMLLARGQERVQLSR